MALQHKNLTNEQSGCLIAFGSNLSSDICASVELIEAALSVLSRNGLLAVEISGFFQTPAFPAGAGPDFVNGVLRAQTRLSSEALLAVLHDVEATFGRTRQKRWGARVLDLDLIDFGGQVAPNREVFDAWLTLPLDVQMERAPEEMILPHPRVQDRPFVLIPMQDVAPDWVHPVLGLSVTEMLSKFSDVELAEIKRLSPPKA